eukprot:4717265-Pyramimonas_sp.AAC.1
MLARGRARPAAMTRGARPPPAAQTAGATGTGKLAQALLKEATTQGRRPQRHARPRVGRPHLGRGARAPQPSN